MTLIDMALVARCVESWEAWEPYAAKRGGEDYPRPDVLPVHTLLRKAGITWRHDPALYLRYERAVRKRATKQERPAVFDESDRSTTCPKCGRDDFPDFRARRIHESKVCTADNAARMARLVARYEAGDDVDAMVRQEGVTHRTIYRLVDAAGVDRRRDTTDRRIA